MPFEQLKFYQSPESFVLEATDAAKADSQTFLCIQRKAPYAITTSNTNPAKDTAGGIAVHGVYGLAEFNAGPALVLITGRENVGSLAEQDVWKVTSTAVYYTELPDSLSDQSRQEEAIYRNMLETSLADLAPFLYFSYNYDLTNNLQTNCDHLGSNKALWEDADPRFFWNYIHVQSLAKAGASSWILPVMHGFARIENTKLEDHDVQFSLLSRRSRFRVGVRFNQRGIDEQGNVANQVETEQILVADNQMSSFVQSRGSIPVYWTQQVTMRYTPKVAIQDADNIEHHAKAFYKHIEEQTTRYGDVAMVNLVDAKGDQQALSDAFAAVHQAYQDKGNGQAKVDYVHWDFHHMCRKMKYENIEKDLWPKIADDVKAGGFWLGTRDGDVMQRQTHVVRTNCMDCLDRTNVVQSVFDRMMLVEQLKKMTGLYKWDAAFESVFRNVWADNADACSIQYSGTPALKTDFTRTGKRSIGGALQDGRNSVMRYVYNNLYDGERQDSFRLLSGEHQPKSAPEQHPFATARRYGALSPAMNVLTIFVMVFMMLAAVTVLVLPEDTPSYAVAALWLATLAIVTKVGVIGQGKNLVDVCHL